MNKKERVLAAIKGEKVDHVPALFSLHFPKEVAFGEAAAKAHVNYFHNTDCDVLKIMNENLMPSIGELTSAHDWDKVKALRMDSPLMVRQLDLIKRILDEVGDRVYSTATIHGVCASSIHPIESHYGYPSGRELMCDTLRTHRQIMLDVHKRVADTMSELAYASIKAGANSIYYAALGAEKHYYTDEEFAACIKPYDLQIMQAAKEAGGQVIMHICKENLNMHRYADYNPHIDVVNWGVYETNFSIEEGKELFPNRTILGGLANRSGVLVDGSIEELQTAVKALVKKYGPTRFILGADCTLPTEISTDRIAAAVHAVG